MKTATNRLEEEGKVKEIYSLNEKITKIMEIFLSNL